MSPRSLLTTSHFLLFLSLSLALTIISSCKDDDIPTLGPCEENPECTLDCLGNCEQAGGFTFLPAVVVPHELSRLLTLQTPGQPLDIFAGHFNSDEQVDILLNLRWADDNEVSILYGNEEGTFDSVGFNFQYSTTAFEPEWHTFTAHTGDFDGDGIEDISWNLVTDGGNRTHTTLLLDDTYFPLSRLTITGGWGPYQAYHGDINGDERMDMVYNELNNNRTYLGLAVASGFINLRGPWDHPPLGSGPDNWGRYEMVLGNFYDDQRVEPYWVSSNELDLNVFSSHYDVTANNLAFSGLRRSYITGIDNPELVVGDFTGDNIDDILLLETDGSAKNIALISESRFSHRFTRQELFFNRINQFEQQTTGDVNGDNRTDLILMDYQPNTQVGNLVFRVGLGHAEDVLQIEPEYIQHPDNIPFNKYTRTLVADLNKDGKDDLIWVRPELTQVHIHIALAD